MDYAELKARVDSIIDAHKHNGELTDGQALDAIYDLISYDDLDNDEKIYCLNELLTRIKEA